MTQFHPTGMIWPPSVRGLLVTEGVRGDGGTLRNKSGERFMFNYVPAFFRAETADTEKEADAWFEDKKNNRRTPDLLPRDEVARAINSEVKAGRGTEHGGVFLDIATRRSADYIKRRLPSMYHQFKELADVDITKQQMEIGPTLHYIMGGIRVDPDTAAATVPGLYAAGEVAAGMHGANRLGGNSLSDLLVFGRRAGEAAAEYSKRARATKVDDAQMSAFAQRIEAPFEKGGDENPYAIHSELQDMMQSLVGIIRRRDELEEALAGLERLRARAARARVTGSRIYNPGWHLALDLENLVGVSEAVTRSALIREESRGGHTREDFPKTDPEWGTKNVVTRKREGRLVISTEPIPKVPAELGALLGEDKPSGEAATGAKTAVAAGDD
jgi:succinate dehydrogenase / fumarate reductase flavoprotein subunit